MMAEGAIRRVLAEYCHRVDDGRLDELVELFTLDGTFVFGKLVAHGRGGVKAWFEQNHTPEVRGKHLTTNTVVDVDGWRAAAVSDFVFLAFQDRRLVPLLTGRYHDEFRSVDGRWLIHTREAIQLRAPR